MELYHKEKLHIKYQGSRPSSFRQEDLFYVSLYKHLEKRPPEAGNFWTQEHNLSKLGKGSLDDASLLDDAKYQISRLYA